jgi:hypothetical protein
MPTPAPHFLHFWVLQDSTTGRLFSTSALDAKGMIAAGNATRAPDGTMIHLVNPITNAAATVEAREAERLLSSSGFGLAPAP